MEADKGEGQQSEYAGLSKGQIKKLKEKKKKEAMAKAASEATGADGAPKTDDANPSAAAETGGKKKGKGKGISGAAKLALEKKRLIEEENKRVQEEEDRIRREEEERRKKEEEEQRKA